MSPRDSMSDSPPSAPTSSSRTEKTGSTNASASPMDALQSLITSFKHLESVYSGTLPRSSPLRDEECARPPTSADSQGAGQPTPKENKGRNCPVLFLLVVPSVLIMFVAFSIAVIAAVTLVSLLLSFVGVTILGLARTSGGVYTDVSVVSLIVATVCGAAIIIAAGTALVLAFLPVTMCCDDGTPVALAYAAALFGGIVTTFFAPAIGIAVTNGHIIGLSQEFRATEAMRMNAVGLGGVLACVLAELILSGIVVCLESMTARV